MIADPSLALPPDITADLRLALGLHRDGKLAEAIDIYQRSLRRVPGNPVILVSLGAALIGAGRTDEAIAPLEQALKARPGHPDTCFTLAEAYRAAGRIEDAYAAAETGLKGNPDYIQGRIAMADALLDMGRHEEARSAFEAIHEQSPDDMSSLGKLGAFHYHAGEFRDAEEKLSAAAAALPEDVEVHWHLASLCLSERRWGEGWPLYRWRWAMAKRDAQETVIDLPVWSGEPLNGKRLIVWGEQGLGDELMFSTCLPDLLEKARPSLCVWACDRRLAPVMGRNFPALQILPMDRDAAPGSSFQMPECDAQISAGDLPSVFRKSDSDFPDTQRLVYADPGKTEAWRQRLGAVGDGLKVGIAWRGGTMERFKRAKSTTLADWTAVLSVPGVDFINLQYGDCTQELAAAADSGYSVHHFDDLDPVADPDSQLALIANLDLVIQTSNASAHMAGALGVPVWNLLPFVADWRWGLATQDCLWYRSMRLLRQPSLGAWAPVIGHVAADLRVLVDAQKD